MQAAIKDHNESEHAHSGAIELTDTDCLDAYVREKVKEEARLEQARDDRKTYELRLKNEVAAAQQPLIDLLGECRCKLDWSVTDGEFVERIDKALAKVKEGKS